MLKNNKYKKIVIVILALVVYFALLTWISFVRAAAPVSWLSRMSCSRAEMRNRDKSVTIGEDDVLFGPYLDLTAGNYLITVSTDSEKPFRLVVTGNGGETVLAEPTLNREVTQFPLALDQDVSQIEVVLQGEPGRSITVFDVQIKPVKEIPDGLPFLEPEPVNYLARMSCSREEMRREDGSVAVEAGDVLFGPYLDLTAGNYLITVSTDSEKPFRLVVTGNGGETVLAEPTLNRDVTQFPLALDQDVSQIEVVLRGEPDDRIVISAVYIEPVD